MCYGEDFLATETGVGSEHGAYGGTEVSSHNEVEGFIFLRMVFDVDKYVFGVIFEEEDSLVGVRNVQVTCLD